MSKVYLAQYTRMERRYGQAQAKRKRERTVRFTYNIPTTLIDHLLKHTPAVKPDKERK